MTWTIRCVYVTYDKGSVFKINTFDEAKMETEDIKGGHHKEEYLHLRILIHSKYLLADCNAT